MPNKFTRGVWEPINQFAVKIGDGVVSSQNTGTFDASVIEREANAKLIATAGTVATKLAQQGYDAMKVLEALLKLVELADSADEAMEKYHNVNKGKGDQRAKYQAACDLIIMDVSGCKEDV